MLLFNNSKIIIIIFLIVTCICYATYEIFEWKKRKKEKREKQQKLEKEEKEKLYKKIRESKGEVIPSEFLDRIDELNFKNDFLELGKAKKTKTLEDEK